MNGQSSAPYTFESLATDLDAVEALFDLVLRRYEMELAVGPCNALYGISRLLQFALEASHEVLLQDERAQNAADVQA